MKKINKIFHKDKIIPLDLFLEKALYDQNYGYYQKKNPFGKKGDFVTAPNISNIVSEVITIWIISFWKNLQKPKNFNFIELGPGNGDFCIVLLNTLKKFPDIFNSIKIILYEKSKGLREIQKKRIVSEKVTWINNLKEVKNGPALFFGNEFLDALPIKQFKKKNNDIFEKYVHLKKDNVNFIFKKAVKKQISKLKNYSLLKNDGIIEYPEYGFRELDIMCKKINKLNGGALFIDYGYMNNKNTNTLQSVMKHKYNDIKKNVGDADITSLVNFSLYKEYFSLNGLLVEDIISQSYFLQRMGILERAKILSKKLNLSQQINLNQRLKRLIHPKMMGKNFKVIFTKSKKCKFSLAFK